MTGVLRAMYKLPGMSEECGLEEGLGEDLLLQLIPQPHNYGPKLHPTQLAKAAVQQARQS